MPRVPPASLYAALLALAVVAYLPVWRKDFIDFDDELRVKTLRAIQTICDLAARDTPPEPLPAEQRHRCFGCSLATICQPEETLYCRSHKDLTPAEHVRMQAALQRHVDSAISKTVNVPETISFEDFQEVYREAYRTGCKGCTTYRPNAVTGSVLAVKPSEPARVAPPAPDLPKRPEQLIGATYKLRWEDHALYVTCNDIAQDGVRRPFEVFVNSKNLEHYAWVVALTRMISAVFRRGGDVAFVAQELKEIFDPRGGQWIEGRYVPSLVAAIGAILERHMRAIGFLPVTDESQASTVPAVQGTGGPYLGPLCPRCSQPGLVKEAGCLTCVHCGWSKCS